jgi:radical SAM protein (TIGR01212 family)
MKKERYRSFNTYLRNKFTNKICKITIDAGFTCPNRNNGKYGCIYCDELGSGHDRGNLSIPDQVRTGIKYYQKRNPDIKYMIYFQAFSNTNDTVENLKLKYDSALITDDIVGILIGTRPDCIDEEKLDMIQKYTEKYEVWIEYGLQVANDKILDNINRGHSVQDFIDAVNMTKNRNIKICSHMIVGLPETNNDDVMKTVKLISDLNIDGIKIHSLYINKNTEMERMYNEGLVKLFEMEEYVQTATNIIEHVNPNYIIQRMTGEGNKKYMAVPKWAFSKLKVINLIKHELEKRDTYQGIYYDK